MVRRIRILPWHFFFNFKTTGRSDWTHTFLLGITMGGRRRTTFLIVPAGDIHFRGLMGAKSLFSCKRDWRRPIYVMPGTANSLPCFWKEKNRYFFARIFSPIESMMIYDLSPVVHEWCVYMHFSTYPRVNAQNERRVFQICLVALKPFYTTLRNVLRTLHARIMDTRTRRRECSKYF